MCAQDGVDYNVGGTSAAAPLWAGFAALINQQAVTISQPRVGFLNPLLCSIGGRAQLSVAISRYYRTATTSSSSSPTNFFAVAGYDLCTGWGTPVGQDLIDALAPLVTVTLPASATKGDGVLAARVRSSCGPQRQRTWTITLTSSDTNRFDSAALRSQ